MMCQYIIICVEDGKGIKEFIQDLAQQQDHANYKNNALPHSPCCAACSDNREEYQANASPNRTKKKKKSKKRKRREIAFEDVDKDAVLMTIDEACEKIGVCRSTLKSLRDDGHLTNIQKGKRGVRFKDKQVKKVSSWYKLYKTKLPKGVAH